MTAIDAAFHVLRVAGTPLHYREITRRMLEQKLWATAGQTPWETVNARLAVDINKRGETSRFVRVGPGLFSLRINESVDETTQRSVSMSLENTLSELAERASEQIGHLETEEATKHALVMPFIQALGYNVFDPREIVPEFTADVGTRKGEKVDYALLHDGKPTILFECKKVNNALEMESVSQLIRYFTVTEARIAVLTNGIVYKFFSDLDESNKMDQRPFLEIDLLSLDERSIAELRRFTKQSFDIDKTLEAAATLKYTRGMKQILIAQLNEPDEEFMKWLVRQVYPGILTKQVRERFTPLVARAFREFINDRINLTLKSALDRDTEDADEEPGEQGDDQDEIVDGDRGIVTTAQELEGFMIVKAMLRTVVDVSRVTLRDTKSYCGIILDDNSRKPICRLWFNRSQLYLGVFNENKKETRNKINSLDGMYGFAEEIRATTQRYLAEEL
ncbi:MAG: HTH domain-containing protein [Caldilineaceae bacterium]|nr:HTH domain-containing protein [Caldilineaceae bacterium]